MALKDLPVCICALAFFRIRHPDAKVRLNPEMILACTGIKIEEPGKPSVQTGMKTPFYILAILLVFGIRDTGAQAADSDSNVRYMPAPGGYIMVLRQGDVVFEQLEKLAVKEQIPFAGFTGFGFVNIQLGFFNFSKKKYRSKKFNRVELASMNGTIAWQDGKPSLHAHGVVGNKRFRSRAGHILSAEVSTGSVEIMVMVKDRKLEGKKDASLGANILLLEE